MPDTYPNNRGGLIDWLDRVSTIWVFLGLALITVALRICYTGYLFEDDGLWFTAAQEILCGKTLYSEIYFDKPPLLPLTYATVFGLFGGHLLTIRVFTMLYSLAISAVLFRFGSFLYGRVEGLLAALMFTIFSTTFSTGHMQGFNSDFMMALPYTGAAFLFVQACGGLFGRLVSHRASVWMAFAGGALVGLAFQTNVKGVLGLLFLVALLIYRGLSPAGSDPARSGALALTSAALGGAAIACLPFLAYIGRAGALRFYVEYVFDWGFRYANYYSAAAMARTTALQTLYYFAVNPFLLITLVTLVVTTMQRRQVAGTAAGAETTGRADAALLMWLVASYAGVAVGGRFYGHYFFQLLPPLCLLGARGLMVMLEISSPRRIKTAVAGALMAACLFSVIRFHGRTVSLALDWVRGARDQADQSWYYGRRNDEEKQVAMALTGAAGEPGIRDCSVGEPTSEDSAFVWGYRPEIYVRTRLAPAARFLSSQHLTGVPADVHYAGDDYKALLSDAVTSRYRKLLVEDLERTRPKYLIDAVGDFNADLAITKVAELHDYLQSYRRRKTVGSMVIYVRRDLLNKPPKPGRDS